MDLSDNSSHPVIVAFMTGATIGVIFQTLFYGIFVVVILFSTHVLLREKPRTRVKVVMLVTSLCMFAISSAVWTLSLVNLIKIIKNVGSPDPVTSLDRAFDALNNAGNPLYESIEIIYSINPILADGVIIWRACVLWQGNKSALIVVSCFLIAGYAVALFISVGCAVKGIALDNVFCGDMQIVGLVMFLSTNVATTFSIMFTAWRQRRFIVASLGRSAKRTHAENILVLLIESGALYCLICVVFIFCEFIRLPGNIFVIQWSWPIMTHISGIYPTIILLLVALKKTVWDSFGESGIQATLPGIQFRSVSGALEDMENATDHPPSVK
ncbi:hypothetical protein HETIRDRAFT_458434 [Heterobasidion irregulare TC 32-1]|uniref:G protein-coupled receptor n=1 Tax=Heterobasidion irregulare (strain TC 32-1) TaxID=747525 RepID=W4K9R8_HETIT|nr:uncharacterized protein HETIRDRAFT_458434 [Heterobasidion irregulare TC 32-1]ETW82592.1 hypothetical protein HETIRDRAFT_458434 [Heterobasidion irregulare TC 32-1]